MLDKINAAMVIDQPADGIRLLDKAQREFPGDYDVARTAVARVPRDRRPGQAPRPPSRWR
jgi:hypothetical protein